MNVASNDTAPDKGQDCRIALCFEGASADWTWISHHVGGGVRWSFFHAILPSRNPLTRLQRLSTMFRAVWAGRKFDYIITLGPGLASATELARKVLRVRTPHINYFLNFTPLPVGVARARITALFKTIDRFIVSSSFERELYASYFELDKNRIDVVLWGVNSPDYDDNATLPVDRYVSAIGGNNRDYRTLMATAASLPNIRFVVVARPHNLIGLPIPENVEVRTNIPVSEAMAIIRGSTVMAMPLADPAIASGHVTLVAAFYLGTPTVVTESPGVADYVRHGETGILVQPGSASALSTAISQLFSDEAACGRISSEAFAFAANACTQDNYVRDIRNLVDQRTSSLIQE